MLAAIKIVIRACAAQGDVFKMILQCTPTSAQAVFCAPRYFINIFMVLYLQFSTKLDLELGHIRMFIAPLDAQAMLLSGRGPCIHSMQASQDEEVVVSIGYRAFNHAF